MKKVIGIVLSLAGLALIALTSLPGFEKYFSWLPAFIQLKYVMIAGLMLVVLGVVFTFDRRGSRGKVKQSNLEVPIYEGEGKNVRIVGYKRE
jgi:uncharacterized membrane protein